MDKHPLLIAVFALVFLVPSTASAGSVNLDFEVFPDSTTLTTQYSGLTFTNATVITAGITLNEFEFPPYSGTNVIFDDGGPISLAFARPIVSFSAYFTYLVPITLTAFDSGNNQVSQASSLFSSNLGLSGELGSRPNEYVELIYPAGFSHVIISGDSFGSSFTMDDALVVPIPEPDLIPLLAVACGLLCFLRSKRSELSNILKP